MLHELARWGARTLGPPPDEALRPGWLRNALEIALSPVAGSGRIAFRVGEEEASVVAGHATPGIVEDYDVLVETDANGFYRLLVDGSYDGVRVDGDRELLARAINAVGDRAASRLSTSHARRTSASVVRALPTASRST